MSYKTGATVWTDPKDRTGIYVTLDGVPPIRVSLSRQPRTFRSLWKQVRELRNGDGIRERT